MVVQHNMQAANANRMLNITTNAQSKSTEKLSSGYRINRAADDAAGLTISEKMRKQIKGLDRASTNAQDGVSCVQTAEGALTEVHSMLQRMNELAVQSANGTNSETDRKAIQDEVDQLTKEIDRVSETTKFNETYLLKGDNTSNGNTKTFANNDILGTVDGLTVAAKTGGATIGELSDNATVKLGKVEVVSSNNTNFEIADAAAQTLAKDVTKITKNGNDVTVTLKDGTTHTNTATNIKTAYGIEAKVDGSATISKKLTVDTQNANITGTYTGNLSKLDPGTEVTAKLAISSSGTSALSSGDKALILNLHVGADSDSTNKISIAIDSMSAKGIGVDGLDVSTESSATSSIDTIKDAIQKVSSQRSSLGAVQNRLEHTINNLDNVVENTTSAESRIRDTDMAKEMVNYSKNNILAQAGQSMLAQANQANQGVLSLLQ
ncbi:flagellin N-terminal helical domain-containing protein [Agathobacter sp.]